jgi:hypothetical protein
LASEHVSLTRSARPHVVALVVALVVGLIVAGCGPRQSEGSAPPYSTATAPAPGLKTSFPAEKLRFTLPPMANDQEAAARVFIAFQRAYLQALRERKLNKELRETTQPALLKSFKKILALGGGTSGKKTPPVRTLVKVSTIAPTPAGVGIILCMVAQGKHKPLAAVLTGLDKGDLLVAAYLPDPKHKKC